MDQCRDAPFGTFFAHLATIRADFFIQPQAEDSPNTKTSVATTGFILTPLNYFDSDISMDMNLAMEPGGVPFTRPSDSRLAP